MERTGRLACLALVLRESMGGSIVAGRGRPALHQLEPSIISRYGDPCSGFRGFTREIRAGHRTRSPRATADRVENLLLVFDALWRSAKRQCVPGVSGTSGSLTGVEPEGGGIRGSGGDGLGVPHQRSFHLRAEKLFLPRPAEGLPDIAV